MTFNEFLLDNVGMWIFPVQINRSDGSLNGLVTNTDIQPRKHASRGLLGPKLRH